MDQTSVNNQRAPQQQQHPDGNNKQLSRPNWAASRIKENSEIRGKYKVGQVVDGKIMLFFKAGKDHPASSALVQLSGGGTALLLYNEIPGYPRNILSQAYAKGDKIETEVTAIRPNKNRLSVSLRPVLRRKFASRLDRGHIVEATIIERVNYGYFVDLGGLEALLHKDNLDQNFHNQNETFAIGEKTEVVILTSENDGKRIGVGRWQLFEFM